MDGAEGLDGVYVLAATRCVRIGVISRMVGLPCLMSSMQPSRPNRFGATPSWSLGQIVVV